MRRLLVVLALGATGALPAAGQEIGVSLGRGSSDFLEFGRPMSVAAHAQLAFPLWPVLRLRAGYRWSRDEDRRAGTTCDSYWPAFEGCSEEPIVSTTRLRQWDAGLTLAHGVGDHLELRGGILRVHSTLKGRSVGAESGRSAGNVYPNGSVWSTALVGEVAWKHVLGGWIGAVGRIRHERLDFRGCVMDAGAPFCGEEALLTFEVGLAVTRPDDAP